MIQMNRNLGLSTSLIALITLFIHVGVLGGLKENPGSTPGQLSKEKAKSDSALQDCCQCSIGRSLARNSGILRPARARSASRRSSKTLQHSQFGRRS